MLELEAKLSPGKRKIWRNIKGGLAEAELIEQGELKEKSGKEFLNVDNYSIWCFVHVGKQM